MEQTSDRGGKASVDGSELGRRPDERPTSDLASLENALGYRFENPALLEQALTHSSFAHERRPIPGFSRRSDSDGPQASAPPSPDPAGASSRARIGDNERLEFLGDAILGFVISDMLFAARPDLREGELSRLKAFIVSAANLVLAAESIGLGVHLRLGKGEEKTGGRAKRALLVDGLEAILAAVFLDGGLDPARRIIAGLFEAQVREFKASGENVADFKSVLQERLQADGRLPAHYRLLEESGPSHARFFTVAVIIDEEAAGTGQGPSKKTAEQRAAMDALTRHPAFIRE